MSKKLSGSVILKCFTGLELFNIYFYDHEINLSGRAVFLGAVYPDDGPYDCSVSGPQPIHTQCPMRPPSRSDTAFYVLWVSGGSQGLAWGRMEVPIGGGSVLCVYFGGATLWISE